MNANIIKEIRKAVFDNARDLGIYLNLGNLDIEIVDKNILKVNINHQNVYIIDDEDVYILESNNYNIKSYTLHHLFYCYLLSEFIS